MSLRRVGGAAAIVLATMLWISCGDVYRPVVIPVNPTPPNPANFHAVFGISNNAPFNPGTALQIDVAGDTDIGVANMGENPTHAAVLPNNSRVFVASAGSLNPGDSDVITAFSPAASGGIATGLGPPTTFTLPNLGPGQVAGITAISEAGNVVTVTLSSSLVQAQVNDAVVISGVVIPGNVPNPSGYDGNFTISSVTGTTIQYVNSVTGLASTAGGTASVPVPLFCSYLPDFVATTETTAVYVANFGAENGLTCNFASTDSVAMLNPVNNTIANIAYLNPNNVSPAPNPVALAETPNALNLYVVNQGNNTVQDLSPIDLSTIATIPVGATPVWAVARADNRRVYVLSQGSGMLNPIDVASNTVLPSLTNLSVGAGANFILYDAHLNRLYVTNPGTTNPSAAAVYVYSTTGGTDLSGTPNDTPSLLQTISMAPGSITCPNGCSPVSVAALPDGSRFYVASYAAETACSDTNVGTSVPCVIPMLSVFDALSMTVKTPASSLLLPNPALSLLSTPEFSPTQYAVPPVASCVPAATYTPGTTRFRMFTTASADGSHVYVSICDAGSIADINTSTSTISVGGTNSPDSLITDIVAPFGSCTGASCSSTATITSLSIASNVVTFTATNNFIPGARVAISGLTSQAGTPLNGLTLTVLATGLSTTQFECNLNLNPPPADVGTTPDTGTAVPLAPPQAPIFLLTGQ